MSGHRSLRLLGPELRRIWEMARPERGGLAGAAALVLLASGASLALPLGMRALLDQAVVEGQQHRLDLFALALLALFAGRAALMFFGQSLMRLTGERIIARLRKTVYSHLQTLDLGYHSRQKIGDLTSRLGSDAESIRSAVTDVIVSVALHLFQLVGSVAVMMAINWRLSLIMLLVTPLVSVVSKMFSPLLQRLARGVQERLAACSAVAQETLASVTVVQAFARTDHETRRYGRALDELLGTVRRSARVNALFSALLGLLFAVSSVVLFWSGGREVLAGRLTAGDLVAFLFYSQNISLCIGVLAGHYGSLSSATGAAERVFEILDTRPAVMELPGAVPLPPVQGRLWFDRVSFAHVTGRPVLRNLSFRVEPGETVAIVGPSGAGKSTLLHLIPRFFDPSEGRILLDGHDLRTVQLRSLREQIAIVSQEVQVFGGSIRENIRYGRLDAADDEIEAAARGANAHEFITSLPDGYDTQIGERGVQLSGGQRQRLSIARALLKGAPLLILDEATSSVDPLSEAAILEALERLRAGRTTIRVTHRLIHRTDTDRILVLAGGRLVESGSPGELLASGGLYRQMVLGQGVREVEVVEGAALGVAVGG